MTQSFPLTHMIARIEPLHADDTVAVAARRIAETGCGLPVVDAAGDLVGFLGESDVLAAFTPRYLRDLHGTDMFVADPSALRRHAADAGEHRVAEYMNPNPEYLDTDDAEMNAAARFLQCGGHTLPVVTPGTRRVVGVLRLNALLSDLTGATFT